MSRGGVYLIRFVVLGIIPDLALPVYAVLRGIIVKTFPPNGVVVRIKTDIGKYGIPLCSVESVGVGMFVCTRCDSEEAVFGVYRPETSVLADAKPCDIVADSPDLIALL